MSCLSCSHISGHASSCPYYAEDLRSDVLSLERRVEELERLVGNVVTVLASHGKELKVTLHHLQRLANRTTDGR